MINKEIIDQITTEDSRNIVQQLKEAFSLLNIAKSGHKVKVNFTISGDPKKGKTIMKCEKQLDYSSLSDKQLITPPYQSWEHALRASIRLWELILEIPWTQIKYLSCINRFKRYVLDQLHITDDIMNNCPLCEYDEEANLNCSQCPLPFKCSNPDTLYNKIYKASTGRNYSQLMELISSFIALMKNKLVEIETQQDVEKVRKAKEEEEEKDNITRQGNLKVLEESIKTWYHILNLPDEKYRLAIDRSNNTLHVRNFIGNLKRIALEDLGYNSSSILHSCHLCQHYNQSSACPLARSTDKNGKLNLDDCNRGCLFESPYKELIKDPKTVHTKDMDLEYDFTSYRTLVLSFLHHLWQKYLDLDPFNAEK